MTITKIVRGHRGTLDIRSAPGKGTDSTVRLPAIAAAAVLAGLAVPPALLSVATS